MITEDLTECYVQFGHHLYQSKDYIKAQELYLLTLEVDQSHIPALNQAGMCFFKQEMYTEARKIFVMILEQTSDIQVQTDAWLNIACCYRLEKNWEKAEQSLLKAQTLAQDNLRIDEEVEKLKQAKSQALLVVNTQTIFGIKPDNDPSLAFLNTHSFHLN
ncbi:tetratricopeptide repeat protein [Legionella sp. PATHC038]|uniref:tetratricopeptide repeat protein n=1 Tax=Legionella sheltonii TaxID=2992041 RepID=UPI002244D06C|nr:tetratricopeptide repeat protein [Legionella sp. PATHC038]MCW8397744.1 tetratricopeptide repeat protein [Legionella sp. PATHC038]